MWDTVGKTVLVSVSQLTLICVYFFFCFSGDKSSVSTIGRSFGFFFMFVGFILTGLVATNNFDFQKTKSLLFSLLLNSQEYLRALSHPTIKLKLSLLKRSRWRHCLENIW